jgi:hypothetical protein
MRKPGSGSLLLKGTLKVPAPLDANFAPFAISKKAYLAECASQKAVVRMLHVAVERHNGLIKQLTFPVFPAFHAHFNDSLVFAYFNVRPVPKSAQGLAAQWFTAMSAGLRVPDHVHGGPDWRLQG